MSTPERVDLDMLTVGDGVRYGGEDPSHSRVLAAMDAAWPPILVHRATMVVIDGVHRLHAARRRGERSIEVRFVDGAAADTFVMAVRANSAFGKPLSLAERERSARRILQSHGHWSDRTIADACGLSHKTVGALRGSIGDAPHFNGRRIGRDGKARPIDAAASRRRAAEIIVAAPQSSLREVARQVGLSPATVKDVRDRMSRGESADRREVCPPARGVTAPHLALAADNALQAIGEDHEFAEWFEAHLISEPQWKEFVAEIPASRIYLIADAARACAGQWREFAESLEARAGRRRDNVRPGQLRITK